MHVYTGGCHCGQVRFELERDEPIAQLIDCNCSICTKKGVLHCPAPVDDFRIVAGENELLLYQFKSNTAAHWFCKHCGIHAFGRPRNHPERYTVNARCLDDFNSIIETVEIKKFDGQHHPKDQ